VFNLKGLRAYRHGSLEENEGLQRTVHNEYEKEKIDMRMAAYLSSDCGCGC
jgi:hypothetical protein